MNFKKFHVSKNYVNISALTANADSGSNLQFLRQVTLPSGTYTFSCRQNTSLSYATRNCLFVTINDTNSYESTATNYHLSAGLHSITFTLESEKTVALGYWTHTISANCVYDNFMLNTGSTPLPYEPYSSEVWHSIPHYIHKTSAETLTLPVVIYPTGTTATVGLKGNTVQSGTPTPDNPIMPQGTGERTGNLFDIETWLISKGVAFSKDGNAYTFSATQSMYSTPFYFSDTDIPVSISGIITDITAYNTRINLLRADGTIAKASAITYITNVTKSENIVCAGLQFDWSIAGTMRIDSLMLNLGSEALPYEPYGYKIPILNNSQTTNVYLGEVQTTRKIKKLVFDGTEGWNMNTSGSLPFFFVSLSDVAISGTEVICTHYSNANIGQTTTEIGIGLAGNAQLRVRPDNLSSYTLNSWKAWLATNQPAIWYVLATEKTAVVNEPLMKIGDYADTVSGITIPTITGKDSFDVETTLKPSEASLSYTGWHNATVKEWNGSQWNE